MKKLNFWLNLDNGSSILYFPITPGDFVLMINKKKIDDVAILVNKLDEKSNFLVLLRLDAVGHFLLFDDINFEQFVSFPDLQLAHNFLLSNGWDKRFTVIPFYSDLLI